MSKTNKMKPVFRGTFKWRACAARVVNGEVRLLKGTQPISRLKMGPISDEWFRLDVVNKVSITIGEVVHPFEERGVVWLDDEGETMLWCRYPDGEYWAVGDTLTVGPES